MADNVSLSMELFGIEVTLDKRHFIECDDTLESLLKPHL